MTTEQALSLILQFMLSGRSINADAIVQQLAKDDPILLCKLLKLQNPSGKYAAVFESMRADVTARVPHIKALRMATGLGLKEAKDVVDVFTQWTGAPTINMLGGQAYATLMDMRQDYGSNYF